MLLSVNKLLIKYWLLQMLLCVWLNERERECVEGGNRMMMQRENVELIHKRKSWKFFWLLDLFFSRLLLLFAFVFFLRAPTVNQKKKSLSLLIVSLKKRNIWQREKHSEAIKRETRKPAANFHWAEFQGFSFTFFFFFIIYIKCIWVLSATALPSTTHTTQDKKHFGS